MEQHSYIPAERQKRMIEYIEANTSAQIHELAERFGLKTVARGVKVQFVDSHIVVDAIITVMYGRNIVNVAKAVQEKVISVVQSTTGIESAEVNVHVSGVAFEK